MRWRRSLRDRKKDIEQANHLGRALEVNMPDWFETTGDSYFKHIHRTTIELAVAAARGSEAELSVRVAAKKLKPSRSQIALLPEPAVHRPGVSSPRRAEQELEASPKTSSSRKRLSKISRGPGTFLPRDRPVPLYNRR